MVYNMYLKVAEVSCGRTNKKMTKRTSKIGTPITRNYVPKKVKS